MTHKPTHVEAWAILHGPKLCPTGGFECVDESNHERGGTTTMSPGEKPVLPVTVFTDYI